MDVRVKIGEVKVLNDFYKYGMILISIKPKIFCISSSHKTNSNISFVLKVILKYWVYHYNRTLGVTKL